MRTFKLVRNEDFSGVSGTGEVATGVQFDNGRCVMCWDTETSSMAMYESIGDIVTIHGHEGRTVVRFDDNGETLGEVDSWSQPVYESVDSWGNSSGSSWG